MTAFAGSALLVQWVWTGGTLSLDTDYRTFSYTPQADFFEETAGAATSKEYILSMKSGEAKWGGVMQAGSMPLFGSALTEGALGTLRWAPEGTAGGKYHGTIAAFCQGLQYNEQYNQLMECTCGFMQSGARTEGTVAGW